MMKQLAEMLERDVLETSPGVRWDDVITDPLCKPFSIGTNLICVYSKKHMLDDPELMEIKRKANTPSLKEMATLLRSASQIIWIDQLPTLWIGNW
ncbi:unnamed protein product [Trifolium pratense]|uniref:Uncharacterized protein n=1 Tax=Trifolium pratense TaxID=57577 RepID=A0ACB0LXX7_TRIPR|nr:unnamed protein product [Trifolium pratense]